VTALKEMYIDDYLKGTQGILASDILEPINLGSSELVSMNRQVDIVEGLTEFGSDRG
jgi:GDP-D-mannose 3',5'-epimerase